MFKRIQNNASRLFVVAIVEMILFFVSQNLIRFILLHIYVKFPTENEMLFEFLYTFTMLMLFSVHIILCVLYMYKIKPESLQFLHWKPKFLLKGLGIGFLVNALICTGAILGTGMKVSFSGIQLFLIPIFFANIIQCAAEEVLLRAYVPSFMEKKYSWNIIAFVSGALFVIHHVQNLSYYGFNFVFCLNVFLIGCLLVITVKYTRNVWWAIGFHSAWNFTQEYLFGLPNSGTSSILAVLSATNAKSNFFFNETYGNEASILTTVVIAVLIFVILKFNKVQKIIK